MHISCLATRRRTWSAILMSLPHLVATYPHADLDGTSCTLAYTELLRSQGVDAHATLVNQPHAEAVYALERLNVTPPDNLDPREAERISLVDVSVVDQIDPRTPRERVVEIIDHRTLHEATEFPNAKAQIELVGAAATLVAERFQQAGKAPSAQHAGLLYGAIASNTILFQASVTTDRDRAMAAWLQSIAQLPEDFIENMFAYKSDVSGDKLHHTLRNDFSWREVHGVKIGIAQLEILNAHATVLERRTELETLLEELCTNEGADITFLNAIDLMHGTTTFFAPNKAAQECILEPLELTFDDNIAQLPYVLLRKQIGPKILAWHERGTLT